MKQNYLKLMMLCLFFITGMSTYAYDCEVDGIYYDLNTTNHTANVTYAPLGGSYSGIVNIPEYIEYNGVTYTIVSIGDYAFSNCNGLTELTIGNSVTSIGMSALFYCSGLAKLTIGNSVTSIGDNAFQYCSGLTELTFPNSVTSIGGYAFDGCRGLTELTIPSSVSSIGTNAFRNWSLEKIMVEEGNPYYDSREDCNGIIRTENNELILGCQNTHIPNSVTSIGRYAFQGCRGLTELTIPNSVTSIGLLAFNACTSLLSVTSLNLLPPTAPLGFELVCFDDETYQNATLHVPAGCKEAYQQAECWKNFLNIQDDAVTGIESVKADKQGKTAIYTLDGKRLQTTNVADLPTGIYIVNGKKVVVK